MNTLKHLFSCNLCGKHDLLWGFLGWGLKPLEALDQAEVFVCNKALDPLMVLVLFTLGKCLRVQKEML